MASILKVDQIETPSGVGNISFAQPLSGDGSQLTGVGLNVYGGGAVTAGDVLYYDGTTWTRLPKGTAAQVLKMNTGATAPEWGTDATGSGGITVPASSVAGDTLYYDGSVYTRLAKGTAGQTLVMNSGATAPEWGSGLPTAGADGQVLTSDGTNWASEAAAAGGGGGAWEYVEKVIPTTAISILVLQSNIASGYDYLVTWERIRHQSDTMLTCHLMNGSGPTQVSSGNLGISHYVGQAAYHDYAIQATDEFHISRVNASGGGSTEDQWWGSMMLINPGAALETSGWFEGGMRNAQYIFSTSGHWINDTAEAITGLTFGGYGAMTAQGEFISYRRKRSA